MGAGSSASAGRRLQTAGMASIKSPQRDKPTEHTGTFADVFVPNVRYNAEGVAVSKHGEILFPKQLLTYVQKMRADEKLAAAQEKSGASNAASANDKKKGNVTDAGSEKVFQNVKEQVLADLAKQASSTASSGSQQASSDSAWFVEDAARPGWWEPHSAETSKRLDSAVANGDTECLIVYKNKACTVYFGRMEQGSGAAGTMRKVKRAHVTETVVTSTTFSATDRLEGGSGDPAAGGGAGDAPGTKKTVFKHEKRSQTLDPFAAEMDELAENENNGVVPGTGTAVLDDGMASATKNSARETSAILQQKAKSKPHLRLVSESRPVNAPIFFFTTLCLDPTTRFPCATPSGSVSSMTLPNINGVYSLCGLRDSQILMWGNPSGYVATRYETYIADALDGDAVVKQWYPELTSTALAPVFKPSPPQDATAANAEGQVTNSDGQATGVAETSIFPPQDIVVAVGTSVHVAKVLTHRASQPGGMDASHFQQVDYTLRGHTSKVYGTRFTQDSRTLVTASMDSTMRLWDVERVLSATPVNTPSQTGSNPSQNAKAGKQTGSTSAKVSVDCGTAPCTRYVDGIDKGSIFSLTTSKMDNWKALTGGPDGHVLLHDFRIASNANTSKNSTVASSFSSPMDTMWHVTFRECGSAGTGTTQPRQVASCGMTEGIFIWDERSPEKALRNIVSHKKAIHSIAFADVATKSNSGKVQTLLYSCGKNRQIHVHDADTGELLDTVEEAHMGTVYRLVYNPYTGILTSSGIDGCVKEWVWTTGTA